MIHTAILFAIAVAQPAPTSFVNTAQLQADCVGGVGGDEAGMIRCASAVMAEAEKLKVTPDQPSTCMAVPHVAPEQIIWSYIDWLSANPQDGSVEAAPGIMTALLEKFPCGWEGL